MNNIKKGLFLVLSYGLGVASGYLVCKKLLENRYQKEIGEVKETLSFNYDSKNRIGKVTSIEEDEEGVRVEVEADKAVVDNIINAQLYQSTKGRPRFNYAKPDMNELAKNIQEEEIKDEPEEDPEEDPEVDEVYEADLLAMADEYAKQREENMKNDRPYVIEYDEFVDAPDDYEKQSLYFYSDDGYLCSEDDQLIEDDEEIVGHEYEDIFNMQTTAFVRNDVLQTVYEIHRLDRSYKKDVLNAIETPREREFRILARRKEAADNE